MKANELRIGSLVEYNGFAMSAYSITGPMPREDKRFDNKYVIDLFDGAGLATATFDEIKPIPLTEEWLLKFGFKPTSLSSERTARFKFPDDYRFEIRLEKGILEAWVYLEGNILTDIEHIHQLQNIYFALTERELEVEL